MSKEYGRGLALYYKVSQRMSQRYKTQWLTVTIITELRKPDSYEEGSSNYPVKQEHEHHRGFGELTVTYWSFE